MYYVLNMENIVIIPGYFFWKVYNTCLEQPAIVLLLFLHVDIFKTTIQSWKTEENL